MQELLFNKKKEIKEKKEREKKEKKEREASKKLGIYIHVPFCQSRCFYCDFAVYIRQKKEDFDLYVDALCREIRERFLAQDLVNYQVESIFIGGGTPSLLELYQLEKIIRVLQAKFEFLEISPKLEFTIEANPENLDFEKLSGLRSLGINRLSLGVQSFSERLLKKLGRRHSRQAVFNSIEFSLKAGFENINLDLIFGLPEQTLADWEESLNFVLSEKLAVKHFSAYLLTVEAETPFFKFYGDSNHPLFPSETNLQSMYELLRAKAAQKNFEQYEISSFSKPGFQTVHNLGYWENREFIGFGLSAHSYFSKIREKHTRDLKIYLQDPCKTEILESDPPTEELFLALRTHKGLNLKKYLESYSIDLLQEKSSFISQALQSGLLELDDGFLSIPPEKFLISNEIILNLL